MMTPIRVEGKSAYKYKMAVMWRRRTSSLLFIVILMVLVLYSWWPHNQDGDGKPQRPSLTRYIRPDLTLFTWNIWFGNYKTKERMSAIGKTIESLLPSVITFQEVTSQNLAYLQSQSWFRRYHMIPNEIPRNQGYFVIILSLYPVAKWQSIPFPNSRMNRNLLLAELIIDEETTEGKRDLGINKRTNFTIATSHLESMAFTTQEREAQLQQSIKTLNRYDNVCLMGDLNLEYKVDGEIELPSPWFDAWLSIARNNHTNGYTWDPNVNTNIHLSEPDSTTDRFDRVLCKCLNFAVQSIRIIGTRPIQGVFPSDHFALYTALQVGQSTTGKWSPVKRVQFNRPENWKKYLS